MPKGKHLPEEVMAAIVREYQDGEQVPVLARRYDLGVRTVTKLIQRALGPAGTPERPRRPPANKGMTGLGQDRRTKTVQLYHELGSLERVARELGVSAQVVRRRLHEWGEQVNPQARPRIYEQHDCPVCGKPTGMHYGKGQAIPLKTCGAPECRATLAFCGEDPAPVPRREMRGDRGGWTANSKAGARRRAALEERLLVERFPIDDAALAQVLSPRQLGDYQAQYQLLEDRRGARRPGAADSIWHELSRVPVYLRLVARSEGHAAIRLLLDRDEEVFDRFCRKFFADQEQLLAVSRNFRPLLAWRCLCPRQTVWVLESVIDLPEKEGIYGACPVCGACALNIWRE